MFQFFIEIQTAAVQQKTRESDFAVQQCESGQAILGAIRCSLYHLFGQWHMASIFSLAKNKI